MIALLDTNVLIALFDAAHVHHEAAHAWLDESRARKWATCPLTQNGCIRVMSQPQYPGHTTVSEARRRLKVAIAQPSHVFWADSISICDDQVFHPNRILAPRALPDLYLLGLAVENGGRLVTFDRSITRTTVIGASREHLVVL